MRLTTPGVTPNSHPARVSTGRNWRISLLFSGMMSSRVNATWPTHYCVSGLFADRNLAGPPSLIAEALCSRSNEFKPVTRIQIDLFSRNCNIQYRRADRKRALSGKVISAPSMFPVACTGNHKLIDRDAMGLSATATRLGFGYSACISRESFDCKRSIPHFDLVKILARQQTRVDRTLARLDTRRRVALTFHSCC